MIAPRYRALRLGWPLAAHFTRRDDGAMIVTSAEPLLPFPDRLTDRLLHFATTTPDHTRVAKRHQGGDWVRVSDAQARHRPRCIALALIDRDASGERPVAILFDNDIEHLLLTLGAMLAGVPFAPRVYFNVPKGSRC